MDTDKHGFRSLSAFICVHLWPIFSGDKVMRAIKWLGIVLGGLLALLLVSVVGLYLLGSSRLGSASADGRPVPPLTDAASLARGEHLVRNVTACSSCHGENLAGGLFFDDPTIGVIWASNLTRGAGGAAATFTPAEWERAIRHGIGGDGRVLGPMPSDLLAHLTDEDLGAIIGYLQSVPPVDNPVPPRDLTFLATIIFGVLDFGNLPYAKTDHANVGSTVQVGEVSVEYGEYISYIASCRDCHGPELLGRTAVEEETGPPAGPNLTPAGNLQTWTEADFITALRTGATPRGTQLDGKRMPWPFYQGMTDDELRALWLYLQSLPPRQR
jgi:mono/diheme cytochrome c family protein